MPRHCYSFHAGYFGFSRPNESENLTETRAQTCVRRSCCGDNVVRRRHGVPPDRPAQRGEGGGVVVREPSRRVTRCGSQLKCSMTTETPLRMLRSFGRRATVP